MDMKKHASSPPVDFRWLLEKNFDDKEVLEILCNLIHSVVGRIFEDEPPTLHLWPDNNGEFVLQVFLPFSSDTDGDPNWVVPLKDMLLEVEPDERRPLAALLRQMAGVLESSAE